MGETISTLVFRPPPNPTQIQPSKFFYIRIPDDETREEEYNCAGATCGAMSPRQMDHLFSNDDDGNSICDNEDSYCLRGTGTSFTRGNAKSRRNKNKNNSISNHNNTNNSDKKDVASFTSSLSVGTAHEYKIPAFFLRRKGAKITILFSHGNAEDLGMMYRRMKEMAMSLCANVLAYDYTGYGLSTPHNVAPSEKMCYRNIEAAYHHLTEVMKIPPSEIVLYGRSLGSGPSCYLAKKTAEKGNSVAGLILHSPFLSIYRIVIDCRINLVGDMFINKSNARGVRCPVLIIHGTRDDVVPFWHGDELLRSFPNTCRAPPYWVAGLGHNHIEVKRQDEYIKRINTFVEKYILPYLSRRSNDVVGVPRSEQYKPETSLKESGKFVVNQTWMKHGLSIVNEAMNEKNNKNSNGDKNIASIEGKALNVRGRRHQRTKQQQAKYSTNNNQSSESRFNNRRSSNDMNNLNAANHSQRNTQAPEEISNEFNLIKSKRPLSNYASSQTSQCGSVKSVETASSRYLLTKESWATDDEDVSFDDDKENKDNNTTTTHEEKSVSLQTFTVGNLSGFSLESSFVKEVCEISLKKDVINRSDSQSDFMNESVDRYSVE